MRTFSILTLGCKVNQYESAQIRQFLEENGLKNVKLDEKPDLFVVNTCCVTSTASAKSRQFIQRAKHLNDKAVLVVCGCLTARQTAELKPINNGAIHIIAERSELASKIKHIINPQDNPQDKPGGFLPLLTEFKEHTRAFLKVQDGCDGVCSYCIIPKVRPVVQSKPVFEAIQEAKALVSAGHKEIVVTGVCLSAYGRQTVRRVGPLLQSQRSGFSGISATLREDGGQRTEDRNQKTEDGGRISDCGFGIADLLEELAEIEGLKRIRLSSLEPGDISNELLDVFCAHKNIMPHIHLSVQSGSDAILRRMCRQYSAAELREKIAMIKSRLDRPAITCDMIVGFPGETDEDFRETVELAKWAGFSKMHIFPFSAREGTAAAKMKDKVQPKVVKERAEILRQVGDELGYKFREQFVGENCEVLIEDAKLDPRQKTKEAASEDLRYASGGRCERYFMVYLATKTQRHKENRTTDFTDCTDLLSAKRHKKNHGLTRICTDLIAAKKLKKNEILTVKITGNRNEGAEGEMLNPPEANKI